MNNPSTLELLEAELQSHSPRESGEDVYRDLLYLARQIESNDHKPLVEALDTWLKQGTSPRATYAVILAGDLKLRELRHALEELRKQIVAERTSPNATFLVDRAIKALS